MIVETKRVVGSCHELMAGDRIDALYRGTLVHRGQVTERVPEHGLFWIIDDLSSGRRLLEMAELEILQVQESGAKHESAEARQAM